MKEKDFTIVEAHKGLKNKEFSAVELCESYFKKIRKKDKDVSAFLNVTEKEALSDARKADEVIARNKDFPLLAGIPCAIKDNILVEGVKCTAASKMLENYVAPYDATVVRKLKKEGAVIIGKTNMDEFAMGTSTENSAFFPTKNPYDLTRVAGGSSGGPAASVAVDECVYSLGSDTGGSIRLPSSFCGVAGLKPTYGSVSRYGLIAFGSSFDQIGPMAKTVEDVQAVFDIIKGRDPFDATSVDFKEGDSKVDIKKLKIGVPKEYFQKGIDKKIEEKVKEAIKKYEDMGAKVVEISLPHTGISLAVYYIISPSEASANLARYDGIRYGYSNRDGGDLMDIYFKSKGKGFGPEVRRRIILGTYALSSGYYDAYYLRAQKVRTLVKKDFEDAFKKVDVIMCPVSPVLPFKLGEKTEDPLAMYLADVYTVSLNLAGLPGLSLPAGEADGLPVGLQIIGNSFEDKKILEVGKLLNG